MGRDAKATGGNEPAFLFQSTRLREARRSVTVSRKMTTSFQSTRLREARHGIQLQQHSLSSCFNPRACVRRDFSVQVAAALVALVSIHAPA